MNRSRETMQFIQALSAPTRASSSANSSTKNYWLSFRLYQRHLFIVYRSPSTLSSLACAYINPTQQSIRNVSIFFLFSLFNPLNIVAPFFRKDGEKIVFVDDQNLCGNGLIADEKPVNRGIFQRKIETRGPRYWLLIVWNIYERQIRNVEFGLRRYPDFIIDKKKIGNRLWIFAREYGKILRFLGVVYSGAMSEK